MKAHLSHRDFGFTKVRKGDSDSGKKGERRRSGTRTEEGEEGQDEDATGHRAVLSASDEDRNDNTSQTLTDVIFFCVVSERMKQRTRNFLCLVLVVTTPRNIL